MLLGVEVNVGLGDVVSDEAQPPVIGSCLLWPNGRVDEDATWYRSRPRPRLHCVRPGASSRRRGTGAPFFSAHVYCSHSRPSQLLLSSCLVLPYVIVLCAVWIASHSSVCNYDAV